MTSTSTTPTRAPRAPKPSTNPATNPGAYGSTSPSTTRTTCGSSPSTSVTSPPPSGERRPSHDRHRLATRAAEGITSASVFGPTRSWWVAGAGSHRPALAEPDLNLSTHPTPIAQRSGRVEDARPSTTVGSREHDNLAGSCPGDSVNFDSGVVVECDVRRIAEDAHVVTAVPVKRRL